MAQDAPPDIVLLGTEWRPRALIRAQLIEEGFDVVATDSWPMMRRRLRPGVKPRVAIVDLSGLANPAAVLDELQLLMKPDRVVVLAALGTLPAAAVERHGFRVLKRPIAIEEVVATAARAIRALDAQRA